MMRAIFPSDPFPPLTPVNFEVPMGWDHDAAADTLICVFDTASPPHFRTNAIVQIQRTVTGIPVDDFSEQVAASGMATDPTLVIQGEEFHDIDGSRALIRIQTFQPTDVGFAVFQAEMLAVTPTVNPRCADLVQFHASCAADGAELYGDVFRTMIDSMKFSSHY